MAYPFAGRISGIVCEPRRRLLLYHAKGNPAARTSGIVCEPRCRDAVLLSTGGILKNAQEAGRALAADGLRVGLYSMPSIKPLDRALLERLAVETPLIVTIEEHTSVGGLGGAVAEVLAQTGPARARLRMIALRDCFSSRVGDQEYLRETYGLSVGAIVEAVRAGLQGVPAV